MTSTLNKLRRTAKRYEAARVERDRLIREASTEGGKRRDVARAARVSVGQVQRIVAGMVLALLLTAAPAFGAYKPGSTQIAVKDGQPDRPYKRWIFQAKVPTPNATLTVVEGDAASSRDHCLGDALACVSPEGWMYVATPISRFTFRHELGHVFAWEHLGPGRVAYFKRLLRTDAPWEIGVDGYSAPQEAFADAYAICATGSQWMPISADRFLLSTRTYRRVCRMIRRAA